MGSAIFEITRDEPIDSYGISEITNAIVEGNNLCLNAAIETEPFTYMCANTGGVGLEHGFSYGNGIGLILLYYFIALAQYLYFLNKIHKSLRL